MTQTSDWHAGKPAQPGWFTASLERNPDARRYWNGRHWSPPVYVGDPDERAARAMQARGETQRGIEWRDPTRPA